MASADKTAKPTPAPKKEAAPKGESTPSAPAPKAESSDSAPAAPSSSYSRGEGQKAVTQAYKDNWNAIYGKKKKR
jgi:hypothetical protein